MEDNTSLRAWLERKNERWASQMDPAKSSVFKNSLNIFSQGIATFPNSFTFAVP